MTEEEAYAVSDNLKKKNEIIDALKKDNSNLRQDIEVMSSQIDELERRTEEMSVETSGLYLDNDFLREIISKQQEDPNSEAGHISALLENALQQLEKRDGALREALNTIDALNGLIITLSP
jgi:regulator of replication initiation timing